MYVLLLTALAMAQQSSSNEAVSKGAISKETPSVNSPTQFKDMGLGLSLGTPTGFGGKLYMDNRNRILERSGYALQVVLGGDQASLGDWATSADVVFQTKPLNDPQDGYRLPAYYGLGVTGGINVQQDILRGGLRAVAGLVVAIDEMPFELAIESGIAILMVDTPVSDGLMHMMLGQISFRHFKW